MARSRLLRRLRTGSLTRTRERAGLIGNWPTYLAQDTVPSHAYCEYVVALLPLRELVILATFEPQTVARATLDEEYQDASAEGSTRSFQLYSVPSSRSGYWWTFGGGAHRSGRDLPRDLPPVARWALPDGLANEDERSSLWGRALINPLLEDEQGPRRPPPITRHVGRLTHRGGIQHAVDRWSFRFHLLIRQ